MIRIHDTYGIRNMFDVLGKAGIQGIDFNNDVPEYCTTEHDAEFYRDLAEYAKSRGVAICQAHAPSPQATLRKRSPQKDLMRSFRESRTPLTSALL